MFTQQHAAAARDSYPFQACMQELSLRDIITCDSVIQEPDHGWLPVIYLSEDPDKLPADKRKMFPHSIEVEPGVCVPVIISQLTP
jgi:hypothetical protein